MNAPKGTIQQEEERYVLIFVVLALVLISTLFTVGFTDSKQPMTVATSRSDIPCPNTHD